MSEDLHKLRESARELWNVINQLPADEQESTVCIKGKKLCEEVAEVTAPNQQ